MNDALSVIAYILFPSFHQLLDISTPEIVEPDLEEVVEPISETLFIISDYATHIVEKRTER